MRPLIVPKAILMVAIAMTVRVLRYPTAMGIVLRAVCWAMRPAMMVQGERPISPARDIIGMKGRVLRVQMVS